MIEFLQAGGWLMLPIILSSIIAMAIIMERSLSLRTGQIVPPSDIERARKLAKTGALNAGVIADIRDNSLVGRVLATGLESSSLPRHIMKENIEEAGRHAVHDMERYTTALGTISAITPLMGLLGTVLGMIQVFSVITEIGVGSPTDLAGGISQALITTAAGISVAIISLIFHRYFKAKINDYIVTMEKEAMALIEIVNHTNNRKMKSSAAQATRSNASARAKAAQNVGKQS